MDKLDAKLKQLLEALVSDNWHDDGYWPTYRDAIKKLFADAGYVHIPTSQGRNVTVYTSDNNEPLLTEDEWTVKHSSDDIKKEDSATKDELIENSNDDTNQE